MSDDVIERARRLVAAVEGNEAFIATQIATPSAAFKFARALLAATERADAAEAELTRERRAHDIFRFMNVLNVEDAEERARKFSDSLLEGTRVGDGNREQVIHALATQFADLIDRRRQAEAREAVLREAVQKASQMLKISAAEYVPAMSETWGVLDRALATASPAADALLKIVKAARSEVAAYKAYRTRGYMPAQDEYQWLVGKVHLLSDAITTYDAARGKP